MDVREKLVELLESARYWGSNTSEEIADTLLENGVTVQEWIPVTERMPQPFQAVIVCRKKGKGEYVVEQGFKDVGDWWKVYGTRTKKVTHWMPLPEPPKGE